LESSPTDDDFPYTAAGEFDNLDLVELDGLLAKYLRLIG
jgi:hypothetical protein